MKDPISSDESKVFPVEKVIIVVLTIIFLTLLMGSFWDLYGKGMLDNVGKISPVAGIGNTPTTGTPKKTESKTDGNVAYSTYSQCLENTKSVQESKDCCDCLGADSNTRKACRDAAATYDFSKNIEFKTFNIPSTLGRDGDYSAYTASGNQQECKRKCDSSTELACGDFQYCRTACNNLQQISP